MKPTGTVHVERLNGALRDRLGALTRKTHAFAKRDATWDAQVGLQLFDHNFQRAHQALQLPLANDQRRYHHRSPAMALRLTDHRWSIDELIRFYRLRSALSRLWQTYLPSPLTLRLSSG